MRNLLLFLIRYNYVFTFLILEILSMVFVIRNHAYHRAGFLNSAGVITGNVFKAYHALSEYLNLRAVNKMLMEENSMLRMYSHVSPEALSAGDISEDSSRAQYHFIPVKVINFTTNKASNYLTLNKGRRAGIKKDMGVVTGSGIAGIVNYVSDNFSSAMSVLHKDSRISVKVKRFNYPCTMQWNGGNPAEAELIGIAGHLPIAAGDSIITSGFSAIFPENIPVGVITAFALPRGSSFYSVKIRLSANLETLQYAYVVKNLLQEEQRALEKLNDD